MLIDKDLKLRRVQGKNFIIAIGKRSESFSGMIKLNDSAAFIFENLKKSRKRLIKAYSVKYGVGLDVAEKDIDATVAQFEEAGFFV